MARSSDTMLLRKMWKQVEVPVKQILKKVLNGCANDTLIAKLAKAYDYSWRAIAVADISEVCWHIHNSAFSKEHHLTLSVTNQIASVVKAFAENLVGIPRYGYRVA